MKKAIVRRPSNKGLLGKASSARVVRRSANVTVMTPENQFERSQWNYENYSHGRPIHRVEVHYHQTIRVSNRGRTSWTGVMGIFGGAFAVATLALMLLPSLVTFLIASLVCVILLGPLCLLVVGLGLSKFRGLALSRMLFARDHAESCYHHRPSSA
jgi:VIT1/CCC1 family predicted Fe2+/Mn2+ transporter